MFFAGKQTTCAVCPIRENCPTREGEGEVCLEMANVVMRLQERYKTSPKTFSIKGMVDLIKRLEAELAILPRVSERYGDIVKILKDHYVELHKMKYGTKKKVTMAQMKIDVNQLMEQSLKEDEEFLDEKGEVIATVKKKKNIHRRRIR